LYFSYFSPSLLYPVQLYFLLKIMYCFAFQRSMNEIQVGILSPPVTLKKKKD